MTIQSTISADYKSLEKEWLSLTTPAQRAIFWKKMKLLFSEMDAAAIQHFFEQLQKSAADVASRLEVAKKRAEALGFRQS